MEASLEAGFRHHRLQTDEVEGMGGRSGFRRIAVVGTGTVAAAAAWHWGQFWMHPVKRR